MTTLSIYDPTYEARIINEKIKVILANSDVDNRVAGRYAIRPFMRGKETGYEIVDKDFIKLGKYHEKKPKVNDDCRLVNAWQISSRGTNDHMAVRDVSYYVDKRYRGTYLIIANVISSKRYKLTSRMTLEVIANKILDRVMTSIL